MLVTPCGLKTLFLLTSVLIGIVDDTLYLAKNEDGTFVQNPSIKLTEVYVNPIKN